MRRCALCLIDYPDALEFCPSDGAKLPPVRGETKALYDPLIGSTIDGRYIVDAVIGEGGMGLVYSARHAIIDKRVAIKVLRKEAAADESAAQRFLAEAKAASKIGQQNIVDITDFGVLPDGHAYFVMEFLDGITLGKIVARKGAVEPAPAVSIAIQVARGLHAAHGKGIVHRDLKPENIFVLERDGMTDFVKIVDFGIARDASTKKRLTVAGMVMGTPEYMAPEQASGQETDHRVDQYALACILYESLTGTVPFAGENAMQTLTKHVFEPVMPPSVRRPDLVIPPPLEAVIMKSLQKKRDDRYADMDGMMKALQEIQPALQGIAIPIGAKVAAPIERAESTTLDDGRPVDPHARGRAPFLVAAGVVFLVAAGFVAFRASHHVEPDKVVVTPDKPPLSDKPPVAAPAGGDITVELRSLPTGADVYLGDQKIGVTPTTTKRPRGTDTLHFVFKLAGYKDGARDVASTEDTALMATLAREAGSRPTTPTTPVPHPGVGTKKPPTLPTLPTLPEQTTPVVAQPKPEHVPEHTVDHPTPKKPTKPTELRNPFGE